MMTGGSLAGELGEIVASEASGIARYYSPVIKLPDRIPVVELFREQATVTFDLAAITGTR